MHHVVTLALGLTALIFTLPAARAQTTVLVAVPEKLTLKEAVSLAIQHNPQHRDSYVSVQDARSRRRSAGQIRNVTWESAVTQTNRDGQKGVLDSSLGASMDVEQRSGATLSFTGTAPWVGNGTRGGDLLATLTMPLVRGRDETSSKRTAVDNAQLSLLNQELNLFLSQQSLVQRVTQSYYNAVRARELVTVQERAVLVTKQATDDAQKRLDAGLITEIDLTRAQLNLASDRETLANRIQSYRNALDDLILLMGLPVGSFPELTEPVTYAPEDVDLDAAIREALDKRTELQQFRVQKAQSEISLRNSRDQSRPRVDLVANLTRLGFAFLGGTGLGNTLTSLLGLRVSSPVSKTTIAENQAQAERQRDILDYLEQNQRQQIVDEVRGLVRAAETAKSNIELLTANLKVAQRSLQISQRLIEEGLADNRNFLDAQQQVTRTESNLLSAKVDYFLTMVNLRRALGRDLLAEFGVAPLQLPDRPEFATNVAKRAPAPETTTKVTENTEFGRAAYPAALR